MVAKPKILRAIQPNVGIEMAYRRALTKMIEKMHDSVIYWITARYKANEPVIAADAVPATELQREVRKLARRWQKQFNVLAAELAEYFALDVSERTDANLRAILKRGGMTVKMFKMTDAQRDVLKATIQQNVSLIRSIPQQYLTSVEGTVMRSVQSGRDLEMMTKELTNHFGVTKRRAAFIARDQNNKATSALQRSRQIELGITEAVWVHSSAGKKPRPTHVNMNGKRYDVTKGMWDEAEGEYVFPGQLINCRCVAKSVIPGFT